MSVRYMRSEEGAFQDVYDQGEQKRLEAIGWKLIKGTPFEYIKAQREAAKSVAVEDSGTGGADEITVSGVGATTVSGVILPEEKRKPGRPKKA